MSERRPLDLTDLQLRQETPFPPMIVIPETAPKNKPMGRPKAPLADCGPGRLDADQVAEYRRRLARGFYSSPAVVREVARRILDSGDL